MDTKDNNSPENSSPKNGGFWKEIYKRIPKDETIFFAVLLVFYFIFKGYYPTMSENFDAKFFALLLFCIVIIFFLIIIYLSKKDKK